MKNSLFKISLFVLCLLFASFSIKAQEAYKIDETTRLRCDLSEVIGIDTLAIELQKKGNVKGLVIVYGMKGEATGYANKVKERLVQMRGIYPERISAADGQPRQTLHARRANLRKLRRAGGN